MKATIQPAIVNETRVEVPMSDRLKPDMVPEKLKHELTSWETRDSEGPTLRKYAHHLTERLHAPTYAWHGITHDEHVMVEALLSTKEATNSIDEIEHLTPTEAAQRVEAILAQLPQSISTRQSVITEVYNRVLHQDKFIQEVADMFSATIATTINTYDFQKTGFEILKIVEQIDFKELNSIELDFLNRLIMSGLNNGYERDEEALTEFRSLSQEEQSENVYRLYRKLGLAYLLPPTDAEKYATEIELTQLRVAEYAKHADSLLVSNTGQNHYRREIAHELGRYTKVEAKEALARLDESDWKSLNECYFPSYKVTLRLGGYKTYFAKSRHSSRIDDQIGRFIPRNKDSSNSIISTCMTTWNDYDAYGHGPMLTMIRLTEALNTATPEELSEVLGMVTKQVEILKNEGMEHFKPWVDWESQKHGIDYTELDKVTPTDAQACRKALFTVFSRVIGYRMFSFTENILSK